MKVTINVSPKFKCKVLSQGYHYILGCWYIIQETLFSIGASKYDKAIGRIINKMNVEV